MWAEYSSKNETPSFNFKRYVRSSDAGPCKSNNTHGPASSDSSLVSQSPFEAACVLTLGFLGVVADFAVVCEVEPLNLFFGARAQTDNGFDDER